jgi:hypothetical protein
MTWRDAYLAQAEADYAMYQRLTTDGASKAHDQLHYLQMACEKLAKAALIPQGQSPGPFGGTHTALVAMLRNLRWGRRPRQYAHVDKSQWRQMLDEILPAAQTLENLAPAARCGRNVEYPWEVAGGVVLAPCNDPWEGRDDPRASDQGKKLLNVIASVFADINNLLR